MLILRAADDQEFAVARLMQAGAVAYDVARRSGLSIADARDQARHAIRDAVAIALESNPMPTLLDAQVDAVALEMARG